MNGAILGMSRREIARKFDEIVAFAEMEKFLDTPVKRYSSGMYVRLAFAVAAHLEPEILIVDEVLAVGDAQFQKKCLGKMGEVAKGGRTVLFVSHNMAAVQLLCSTAAWLKQGSLSEIGETTAVVGHYLSESSKSYRSATDGIFDLTYCRKNEIGDGQFLRKLEILGSDGLPRTSFHPGEAMTIRVAVSGYDRHPAAVVGLLFKDKYDRLITSLTTSMLCPKAERAKRNGLVHVHIPRVPFVDSEVILDLTFWDGTRIDQVERAATIYFSEGDVYGTGFLMKPVYGSVFLDATMRVENIE
jgi:lipopolysaccharide transport system ATP-binding protein